MKIRVINRSITFPIGTDGPQSLKIKTDMDMQEVIAIGFVESDGAAQQYRIGVKNPVSGVSFFDPVPKQLLLATPNVKNDDRYERTNGIDALGKELDFQIVFDAPSTIAVTLNIAVKQIYR